MAILTEAELLRALEFYMRDYDPERDQYCLPAAASALSSVLGTMWVRRQPGIDWSHLTSTQCAYLRKYFDEISTSSLLDKQTEMSEHHDHTATL